MRSVAARLSGLLVSSKIATRLAALHSLAGRFPLCRALRPFAVFPFSPLRRSQDLGRHEQTVGHNYTVASFSPLKKQYASVMLTAFSTERRPIVNSQKVERKT